MPPAGSTLPMLDVWYSPLPYAMFGIGAYKRLCTEMEIAHATHAITLSLGVAHRLYRLLHYPPQCPLTVVLVAIWEAGVALTYSLLIVHSPPFYLFC